MAKYIAITEQRSRVIVVDDTDSTEVAIDAVVRAYNQGLISLNDASFIDEGGEHYEDETENWTKAVAEGYEVQFQHINANDNLNIISEQTTETVFYGYEYGVLLSEDNPDFNHYSCNNRDLPYGFYDEDQGFIHSGDLERTKISMRKYVEEGNDMTYAVISLQGLCDSENAEEFIAKINDSIPDHMDYDFYKKESYVIYSVCKIDGKIAEGFLEALLTETIKEA